MIKKHLDRILIILGSVIIVIAISLKLYTQYEQNKRIDNYRKYVLDMKKQDETFNQNKSKSKTSSTDKKVENQKEGREKQKTSNDVQKISNDQIKSNHMIGILSIPKIDLCVGIGEGVDRSTLKYSVGHFIKTAMPGEKGNFCVIGHRSYSYGEFFNRLNEMKKNDSIYVESNGKTFRYIVTEIIVVKPEHVSVLNQTKDAEITLITCTPIRVGSHRLIIKGVLVND